MFKRKLGIPLAPKNSFFLWGARQVGKTSFLKRQFKPYRYIDLLNTDQLIKYIANPSVLREELFDAKPKSLVIIDEVQKIPELMNEIHWLIENKKIIFGLSGSSARSFKRGKANLLGGRATRFEMFGLVRSEIGAKYSIDRAINNGTLPRHYLTADPRRELQSYVSDYLRDEIMAEGLTRNLPVFSDFLRTAAISDTEQINFSNVASECGVSSVTAKEYFRILEDTLIASFLPSFVRRAKRRVRVAPKFYFHDVGIVNHLTARGRLQQGGELYGKAFENLMLHEVRSYREYSGKFFDMWFWKTESDIEVDLILGDMKVAIEFKSSKKITPHLLKGLHEIKKDHPRLQKRILVCFEQLSRQSAEGILIYPWQKFLDELWQGKLI